MKKFFTQIIQKCEDELTNSVLLIFMEYRVSNTGSATEQTYHLPCSSLVSLESL